MSFTDRPGSVAPNGGGMRLDQLARVIYGDHIDYYARGHKGMEAAALEVCRPAMLALLREEDYASVVLANRMHHDLEEWTQLQGTFNSAINAAHAQGLITDELRDAAHCAREIRNLYAHSDNPDESGSEQSYLAAQSTLLALDPSYTLYCVGSLRQLRDALWEFPYPFAEPTETVAVLLTMTETISVAARFGVMGRKMGYTGSIPAYFSFADMLRLSDRLNQSLVNRTGVIPNATTAATGLK